jgi:hypothetical protein
MPSKLLRILFCASFLYITATATADSGYHDYASLTSRLKTIQRTYPRLVRLSSLGKTGENREIWLLGITNSSTGEAGRKGALFVCANIEANHLIGTEAVLSVSDYLLGKYGKDEEVTRLLDRHTVYLVPRVNPDGAERFFRSPLLEMTGNLTPVDEDDDGMLDEDPPEDLNGDGFITMMRVPEGGGDYLPDSVYAELLVRAKPAQGQEGLYTLYTEGLDNDRDGRYNEDPPGSVNINRNLPHAYPIRKKDSGPYMTSEKESRAVLDFLFSHREVAVILSYSLHDNLMATIRGPSRTPGRRTAEESEPGRQRRFRQPVTEIHKEDLPYFQEIGKRYREITGLSSPLKEAPTDSGGSLHQWGYFQYGVLSLTTPVWTVPAQPGEKDTTRSERRPSKEKGKKPGKDALLLRWLKETGQERKYIAWQRYTHPELGPVEIGGFVPFAGTNPPPHMLDSLLAPQARFLVDLGSLLPRIELDSLEVTSPAKGLYRIEAVIVNKGYLPTALRHGAVSRSVKPILVKLESDNAEIVAGAPIERIEFLTGCGGAKRIIWNIHARSGSSVTLTVQSEKAGQISKTWTLE